MPTDDTPEFQIHLTDDDLKQVGYLIETSALAKKGWEDTYLAALHLTGEPTYAAARAGISISQINKRIHNDAIFANLVSQADEQIYAKLRDTAIRRALQGTPDTYTNKRGETITQRKYDNRLLIEVLDRFHPELKDKRRGDIAQALEHGITVKFQIGDGAPVKADLEIEATEADEDEQAPGNELDP